MNNLRFLALSFLMVGAGIFTVSCMKQGQVSLTQDKVKQLMRAAKSGDNQTVSTIVTSGINVNVLTSRDGETALIKAAKAGHKKTVLLLLQLGADRNISYEKNGTQHTALTRARDKGHTEIVEILNAADSAALCI